MVHRFLQISKYVKQGMSSKGSEAGIYPGFEIGGHAASPGMEEFGISSNTA